MKILFWASLLIVLYTYAGYPLLMALLARLRPRPWVRAPWPTGPHAPISIVMAVHNGENLLESKLQHLLATDRSLVREIIVISDGSTDATNDTLQQFQDERLKVIVLPQQVGKSSALNFGIAGACGDILLFVDIRPWIEPDALESLLSNFADPAVGCIAGELLLRTGGQDATTAAVSGVYWRYEQWIRNCEAIWDSPVGVYGGFYAIRRSLATLIPAGTILDDMFQPLSVIRQGYRSVVDRNAHVIDRWPSNTAGEFSRKVRTLTGNFQLISVAPWILSPQNRVLFQLVSHKLLRLVVPWCFAALLLTAAILGWNSSAYLGFACLQAIFWILAATSLRMTIPLLHRVAAPAGALLVLNAAAVAAVYKFLFTRGPMWKIWTPTMAEADPTLRHINKIG